MIRKIILRDAPTSSWLLFDRPQAILTARSPGEVREVLAEVQHGVTQRGLSAAGYLSYEAASAFDAALITHPPGRLPVACFGLFSEPAQRDSLPRRDAARPSTVDWRLNTSRAEYLVDIAAIKRQIEQGYCYQVNYTLRQEAGMRRDPWDLFCDVAVDAPYAAYLEGDDFAIVSASPELFFTLSGTTLTCRPMKGTAERGLTAADDRANASALLHSTKNRAENVMITDMVRNDLGRIASPGSVRVDSLFDVEKYPTVWQMTSTVTATSMAPLPQIMAALFPCASVTGAPKASSMAIIADLEDSPREVYTGTIGYLAPSGHAQFNVAIRTAWIDKHTTTATYGIGGGIVWDSDPDAEFEECLAKARILHTGPVDRRFNLLETLLWTADRGYFLIQEHLERLQESAEYFGFNFDRDRVLQALHGAGERFHDSRIVVRLELDRSGRLDLQHRPLPDNPPEKPRRVRLAAEPVDVNDPFLYHKTTRRETYEKALRSVPDCDDVLLWNPDGFVTESSIANVVVELGGESLTPPISCGLLGGTYRRWLLENHQVREREIHLDDLADNHCLTLINSVRGRCPALLHLNPAKLKSER